MREYFRRSIGYRLEMGSPGMIAETGGGYFRSAVRTRLANVPVIDRATQASS